MKAEILRDSVDLFELFLSTETTQTDQESTFCSNLRLLAASESEQPGF